jgi:hypothetical protein
MKTQIPQVQQGDLIGTSSPNEYGKKPDATTGALQCV